MNHLNHPHDADLILLEDGMTAALAAELTSIARAITRGISDDNAGDIVQRTHDPATWQRLRDVLARWLRQSAEFGADAGRRQIEREVFGVKSELTVGAWDIAHDAAIRWALEQADNLMRELQMVTTPRIERLVAEWFRNGDHIGLLIDAVRDGYVYSAERARTIAVTEVTRAAAEGNLASWRASEVVEGKEWRTNRDELVCPICAPLRNTVRPLDGNWDGIPAPPAHPRCRCWIVPVVIMEQPMEQPDGLPNNAPDIDLLKLF